jgi:hypothetical protein
MRRLALIGGLATLLMSANAVSAATPSGPKPGWEARSGVFHTRAAASAHIAALAAKGLSGYVIETETGPAPARAKLYEVEWEFSTQKAAVAEVAKLHADKFVGAVEYSPDGR